MGKHIDNNLEELILQLDDSNLKELELYVAFLLQRQKSRQPDKSTNKVGKAMLLRNLKRIPVPVDNVLIDRSEIYEDLI